MPPGSSKTRKAWNTSYRALFIPEGVTPEEVRSERERTFLRLTIPKFQRKYDWKAEKIRELLASIASSPSGYFLGTVVLVGEGSVIDGQQRLVTLSILSKVLAGEVQNPELSVALHAQAFENNGETTPRIEMNSVLLQSVYLSVLSSTFDPGDSEYRALTSARDTISRELSALTMEEKESLAAKVLSSEFVVIVSPTNEDVYQLFNGLNSTGLALASTDLVKSILLSKINSDSPEELTEFESLWESTERMFIEAGYQYGKYVRYHWFSEDKYVSDSDLYKRIKAQVIESGAPEQARIYLSKLLRDARLYIAIRQATVSADSANVFPTGTSVDVRQKVPSYIYCLKLLKNEQVYSVVLSLFRYAAASSDYLARSRMTQDIRKLLQFVIIAKYTKIVPSRYERVFARMALLDETQETFTERFHEELTKLVDMCERVSFVNHFATKYRNVRGDEPITKFVLEQLVDSEGADFTTLTIEHLLPQGTDWSHWPNILPEQYDQTRDVTESIGNLTLLESRLNSGEGQEDGISDVGTLTEKNPRFLQSAFIPNHSISTTYGSSFEGSDVASAIFARAEHIAEQFFLKFTQT